MSRKKIGLLVLLLFIVIILLILIVYISYRFPGLFIRWPHCQKCSKVWNKEIYEQTYLLNEQENEKLKELVLSDEKRRVNQALDVIGTAAYIDGSRDQDEYVIQSKSQNKKMRKRYGPYYEKLKAHLSKKLGVKCVYAADRTNDKVALPGFHLFNHTSPLAKGWPVASLHVDMQELNVPWTKVTKETFDMTKTLSFTLSVSVPESSGLYVIDKLGPSKTLLPIGLKLRNRNIQKVQYKDGHCYLHHGKHYHMISPYYCENEDDVGRITLQGHALYCESRREWWLYW